MANFISINDAIANMALEFGVISATTLNKYICQSGEIAGFQIQQIGFGPNGEPLYCSQIFDCSGNTPVNKGWTWSLPGMDLCGGLFSSACFPTLDPLDPNCVFYQIDYPLTKQASPI